jgi:hypothetical protein
MLGLPRLYLKNFGYWWPKCLYLSEHHCILATAVAHCLKRYATNRKVSGLIPDGVIGVSHWHNPSDRTMALGSTQPLTEISTRRISWGYGPLVHKAWQPYHLPVPLSWNLGTLTFWNNRTALPLPLCIFYHSCFMFMRPQCWVSHLELLCWLRCFMCLLSVSRQLPEC